MAEAIAVLGVVATIIQVVDFGGKVLERLKEFQGSISDLPQSLTQIKTELPLLFDTLKKMEKAVAAGAVKEDTARALIPIVEGCQRQLETLHAILEKALPKEGISRVKRGFQAFSSLLTQDSKIRKLSSSIHHYIQTLTFYHSAASWTVQTSTNETLNMLRQWLSAPDQLQKHQQILKDRLAGTGLWFLGGKQYARWKTHARSLLWLYGIPGSGKSVLCSSIIEDILNDCHSNPGKAVAYYYFSFNNPQDQLLEPMLRSLVFQFSEKCLKAPKGLKLLLSPETRRRQPSHDTLLEMLRVVVHEFSYSYIVLDALDECKDNEELLNAIETIAAWRINSLHIIVLSRDRQEIRSSLEGFLEISDTVCLQSSLVDEDIALYVRHRLLDDRNLRRWRNDHEILHEIETVLVSKANGMFRWAVCQLDTLGKALNRSILRRSLNSLPLTLDETYERILCCIHDDYREYALQLLQWLTIAARPLELHELPEVVAITNHDPPSVDRDQILQDPLDVMRICPSLITIIGIPLAGPVMKNEESIPLELKAFSFAHYSVKEYLLSQRIRLGPAAEYSIQEESSHAYIARSCLTYLLQFSEENSLSLSTFQESKLGNYTAKFWPYHVKSSGKEANSTHSLVMELLSLRNSAYINWFRFYDMITRSYHNSELTVDRVPPPFYTVSFTGLTEIARLLITRRQANVNFQSENYGTALSAAASHGHSTMVRLLLDMGVEPNVQGGYYGTALQAASYGGDIMAAEVLLEEEDIDHTGGPDIDLQSEVYGVIPATLAYDHETIVAELIAAGADVNLNGGQFGTALQAASARGRQKTFEMLLQAGADVNLEGGVYGTALHAASNNGRKQIVEKLIAAGADVNLQGGGEYATALQAASAHGYEGIVDKLLAAGADVNLRGGRYGSALQAALLRGHHGIVDKLVKNGAATYSQG